MRAFTQRSDSDTFLQLATLTAIICTFLINILSNFFPPKGLNIGEISNTFFSEVKVIPANYAFAIWGLIYLGLIAFGIYQFQPTQRENPSLRRIRYLLILACLAQIVWVFLFVSRLFPLSVLAMLGILISLIGIYLRLGIGITPVTRRERWLVHIPLSVYLAWISVATVVNVACSLHDSGWSGWDISPLEWTAIMLIVVTAIATLILIQRNDPAYPLVIIWAFVAIAVRHSDTLPIVVIAMGLAIALTLLILLFQFRPFLQSLRRR